MASWTFHIDFESLLQKGFQYFPKHSVLPHKSLQSGACCHDFFNNDYKLQFCHPNLQARVYWPD